MRRSLLSLLLPGALLYLLSNGNVTIPLATWLAPVLLLRFSRRSAAMSGQILLLATSLLATYPMLYGIIPPFLGALAFGLTAYYALLVYVPYAIDRLLAPRLGGFTATLVLPAAATATDHVAGVSLGTWNSVAYTQHSHLPLVQLASLTGIWGLTFLIFWTAAVVNWAWDRRFEPNRVARGGLAFALVLGAGARGADVLLVPAWDWRAIDPLHADMAAYRAVEMGFNCRRVSEQNAGLLLALLTIRASGWWDDFWQWRSNRDRQARRSRQTASSKSSSAANGVLGIPSWRRWLREPFGA